MACTLVVGATGYLGRHVVKELHSRGHQVRVLVRDRSRAEQPGPWGAPALTGLVNDWIVGDVTNSKVVLGLTEGMHNVISCLGVTTQQTDHWQIDYEANHQILLDAHRSGVQSFCYINVLNGDDCPARITQAKKAFVDVLAQSTIAGQIIDPSAYFSDMMQILRLVKRTRRMWAFEPVDAHRINPIHGADLAVECVDRIEAGQSGRWGVGGPEVFTWEELGRLACESLGITPRTIGVSRSVLPPMLRVLDQFSTRRADMLRFLSWNMIHDAVGRPTGTHRLGDFWRANSHLV